MGLLPLLLLPGAVPSAIDGAIRLMAVETPLHILDRLSVQGEYLPSGHLTLDVLDAGAGVGFGALAQIAGIGGLD